MGSPGATACVAAPHFTSPRYRVQTEHFYTSYSTNMAGDETEYIKLKVVGQDSNEITSGSSRRHRWGNSRRVTANELEYRSPPSGSSSTEDGLTTMKPPRPWKWSRTTWLRCIRSRPEETKLVSYFEISPKTSLFCLM